MLVTRQSIQWDQKDTLTLVLQSFGPGFVQLILQGLQLRPLCTAPPLLPHPQASHLLTQTVILPPGSRLPCLHQSIV